MLASPLLPSPGFSDETSQYRPAKDLEAFDRLLAPRIEFVEGSSSGGYVIPEGKYKPINESPKASKVTIEDKESKTKAQATIHSLADTPSRSTPHGKSLYTGNIVTAWPNSTSIGSGLNNIGNTCFLNSALQCLLHTPPLLHVLIKHREDEPCRAGKTAFCMACSLRQVVFEVHGKNKRSFTPWPIATKLQVIAKHMRRGRQEDSHEFLRYAIDALQKSCLMGYPAKLDPKLAETTWVHQIFGGRLRSRVTCMSCGHNSDTFDRILDLSVDIHGVTALKEALRKFVAVDHLKGADKYKCEKCKKAVVAEKQFTIHEAPLVLTVHLKRFTPMGRKMGHPVQYDERLNLQPFMSEGQYGPTYSLYAVISHAGGGPNSGHYYAHVKSANGNWYEMNDESVTRQTSAPTGMRNAYILFYMRDKLPSSEDQPNPSSSKTGVVAAMKKRKVVETAREVDSLPKTPAKAPFIGPQLPSSPPAPKTPEPSRPKAASVADPQAKLLKKKIAAASGASSALSALVQYDDESDEDLGEDAEKEAEEPVAVSTKADTPAPQSTPRPSATIPTSSFYGTPASSAGKKRKVPDSDDQQDKSVGEWARTPLSPNLTFSSPIRKRHFGSKSGRSSLSSTPFSRLKGSNNLHQRRDSPIQYGKKKKRLIM